MDRNDADSMWEPKVLDLGHVQGAFFQREGFSRPDWKIIGRTIKDTVPPESLGEAWSEAAMQWVLQVRTDLGGNHQVRRSKEFILLAELDSAAANQVLAFAEKTLESIYDVLKGAAWQWGYGKHVILLFADLDDYYQYVAFFWREGVHPASGGCLIRKDYVHIAMPYGNGRNIRQTLAHELAHNSVVHLPLPTWLNEGLAVLFERTAGGPQRTILDGDLRDRHLAFWNSDNIQKFWAGVSFGEPGDSNELSYSLAEIVVNLMMNRPEDFCSFLKLAQWGDGGQTAALDCLGIDLGQVMGTFLGEGNWRPRRKAMVECWKALGRPVPREAGTTGGIVRLWPGRFPASPASWCMRESRS